MNKKELDYIVITSLPQRSEPKISLKLLLMNKDFKIIREKRRFIFFKKIIKEREPIVSIQIPLSQTMNKDNIEKIKNNIFDFIKELWECV